MSPSLGFGGVLVPCDLGGLGQGAMWHMWSKHRCHVPCGLGGLGLCVIKHIWFKHLGAT